MRTFLKASLTVLLSSCITLLVLEVVLRVTAGAPWPEELPLIRVRPNPRMGWTMVPNDIHYTYMHRVKLNSLGFRGPEIVKKQENEYRILALGDSHVYGQGVPDEFLFTRVVEAGLNETSFDCFFRVINMGVRAYSSNQELALLEEVGIALEPDHVILFFYINDFDLVDLEKTYTRFKGYDWYTFDLSGPPDERRLFWWRVVQVLRKSALIMWSYDRYQMLRDRGNVEEVILRGVLDEDLRSRFSRVEQYLSRMISLSKKHQFDFTLAVIPVSSQLVVNYPEEHYQSWLKRLAETRSVGFLDLSRGLQDFYRTSQRLPIIPYDGHYDSDGHRAMATQVVDSLRKTATCRRNIKTHLEDQVLPQEQKLSRTR